MTIYGTPSTQELTKSIAQRLHETVGRLVYGRFADDEPHVTVKDAPRGKTTLIAVTGPGEERFVHAFLAIDALRVARAKKLTVLLPYAGFARQDLSAAGSGLAAKLVPRALRLAGAHRIITLDPHSTTTVRAVPNMIAISALPALAAALKSVANGAVVIAPDRGARGRAMQLAALLGGLPTAFVEKSRTAPDAVTARSISGAALTGKTVIIIDDLIATGVTIVAAAALARKRGAARVIAAATHGVFSSNARKTLASCCESVVVTDSLPQIAARKLRVITCATVLAKALTKYAA